MSHVLKQDQSYVSMATFCYQIEISFIFVTNSNGHLKVTNLTKTKTLYYYCSLRRVFDLFEECMELLTYTYFDTDLYI